MERSWREEIGKGVRTVSDCMEYLEFEISKFQIAGGTGSKEKS